MRKTVKLFGVLIGIASLIFGAWYYHMFVISIFDRPWILTTQETTITVTYNNWACDCADFVETKDYQTNATSEPDSDDYIFIEPANAALALNEDFYSEKHFYSYVRLTGHFYVDKGIPLSYQMKTPLKPEHSRVFRYNKIELINKQD